MTSVLYTVYSKDNDPQLSSLWAQPPLACKNSIPYSQLLRAKRTYFQNNDFGDVADHMVWSAIFTTGATQKPSPNLHFTASRKLAENKPWTPKRTSSTAIVLTYLHNVRIRNTILMSYRMLQQDPSFQEIFENPQATAYRGDQNLFNHFVSASRTTPTYFPMSPIIPLILTYRTAQFDITSHFTYTSPISFMLSCVPVVRFYTLVKPWRDLRIES